MRYLTQRILGDPVRGDGHAADGTPGDCLRTSIAAVLDLAIDDVPHFAQIVDWDLELRRWAWGRGLDAWNLIAPRRATGDAAAAWRRLDAAFQRLGITHVLGAGPSPRGDFWHVDIRFYPDLTLAWDVHPERRGVAVVEELTVFVPAGIDGTIYPPPRAALTTGPR